MILIAISGWLLASLPLGILIGKSIKFGNSDD